MYSFQDHLKRVMPWSKKTFGEGKRTLGVTAHIREELDEVLANPEDLSEWVDIILLALDGYWRHGGTPETITEDILSKVTTNENRKWEPTSGDRPSHHVKE